MVYKALHMKMTPLEPH